MPNLIMFEPLTFIKNGFEKIGGKHLERYTRNNHETMLGFKKYLNSLLKRSQQTEIRFVMDNLYFVDNRWVTVSVN